MLGQILIRCPRTSSRISVGIITDEAGFRALPASETSTVVCPVCETVHTWSKAQAIFRPLAAPELELRKAS